MNSLGTRYSRQTKTGIADPIEDTEKLTVTSNFFVHQMTDKNYYYFTIHCYVFNAKKNCSQFFHFTQFVFLTALLGFMFYNGKTGSSHVLQDSRDEPSLHRILGPVHNCQEDPVLLF